MYFSYYFLIFNDFIVELFKVNDVWNGDSYFVKLLMFVLYINVFINFN